MHEITDILLVDAAVFTHHFAKTLVPLVGPAVITEIQMGALSCKTYHEVNRRNREGIID